MNSTWIFKKIKNWLTDRRKLCEQTAILNVVYTGNGKTIKKVRLTVPAIVDKNNVTHIAVRLATVLEHIAKSELALQEKGE